MASQNLSREYAKFKRAFVGPTIPRSVRRKQNDVTESKTAIPRAVLDYADRRRYWDRAAVFRYATPLWANRPLISEIYAECKRLSLETGIKHQVDHIVPVKHPLVCGLHVENNLEIISAFENNLKSNKFSV